MLDRSDALESEVLVWGSAAVLVLGLLIVAIGVRSLERHRLVGVRLAARTATHEINNRLAEVAAYAELLARDPKLPPTLSGMAERVQMATHAAAERLRDLARSRPAARRAPRLAADTDFSATINLHAPL